MGAKLISGGRKPSHETMAKHCHIFKKGSIFMPLILPLQDVSKHTNMKVECQIHSHLRTGYKQYEVHLTGIASNEFISCPIFICTLIKIITSSLFLLIVACRGGIKYQVLTFTFLLEK